MAELSGALSALGKWTGPLSAASESIETDLAELETKLPEVTSKCDELKEAVFDLTVGRTLLEAGAGPVDDTPPEIDARLAALEADMATALSDVTGHLENTESNIALLEEAAESNAEADDEAQAALAELEARAALALDIIDGVTSASDFKLKDDYWFSSI